MLQETRLYARVGGLERNEVTVATPSAERTMHFKPEPLRILRVRQIWWVCGILGKQLGHAMQDRIEVKDKSHPINTGGSWQNFEPNLTRDSSCPWESREPDSCFQGRPWTPWCLVSGGGWGRQNDSKKRKEHGEHRRKRKVVFCVSGHFLHLVLLSMMETEAFYTQSCEGLAGKDTNGP
jgi:hypothetical protein